MEYAVWFTGSDGKYHGPSPRPVVTEGRLFVGDRLPGYWVTKVVQGAWTDGDGRTFDGRARASQKKPTAHRS
jgi:hypothetical protein